MNFTDKTAVVINIRCAAEESCSSPTAKISYQVLLQGRKMKQYLKKHASWQIIE